MRPSHLIQAGITGILLLAGPAGAEPRQVAQPVGTEQVSGGVLTVTPTEPSVSSRLSVSGPQGYEAVAWSENGGMVSVNLMAEGRFPLDDGSDGTGAGSVLDGRHLPDGRYRYGVVFYDADGGQRAESGVFFVEDGLAVSREGKRTHLQDARVELEPERERAATALGQQADDFLLITDAEQDEQTYLRLDSVPGDGTFQLWYVQNATGALEFLWEDEVAGGSPAEVMTLRSDGRVGMGTSDPQADLHIFRPGGNIRITDSDVCPNPNASWDIEEDFGKLMFEVVDNCPGDATGGKMWIHGNGNVGIGTNNPGEELEIAGAFPSVRFNDTSGTLQIWDIDADSGNFLVQDVTSSAVPLLIEPGTPNQTLRLNSNGRVGVGTFSPSAKLHVAGNFRTDGDVALSSSRTLKAGFGSVSPTEMLAKVADLPVASWRYKSEEESTRHIGPFAEDFKRLFGLGDGETISVIDAQGVTLAAIQGLQQRLAEKDGEIAALTARLAVIERHLEPSP